jgi:hypothetical protein
MRGERFPLAEQVAAPGIHFGGRRPPVEPLANDYRAIFTSPCLSTLSEFCQVARTGQNVSLLADFVAEVGDDRRVATGTTFLIGRLPSAPGKGWCGTAATELCTALCKAVLGDRRRSDDELCESAEVLRDCC